MAQSPADPATILHERVSGSTLEQIASRHGLSTRAQALRIVRRETKRAVDELEQALRDACRHADRADRRSRPYGPTPHQLDRDPGRQAPCR
jgi:hypothetical protein